MEDHHYGFIFTSVCTTFRSSRDDADFRLNRIMFEIVSRYLRSESKRSPQSFPTDSRHRIAFYALSRLCRYGAVRACTNHERSVAYDGAMNPVAFDFSSDRSALDRRPLPRRRRLFSVPLRRKTLGNKTIAVFGLI